MKTLYLDESGDHSLRVIDPQYPVFVLGGVILAAEDEQGIVAESVAQLKRELFGRDDVLLHTADIVRQRGPFATLVDGRRRMDFLTRLNDLLRGLDFTVIACAIRKDSHLAAYGEAALDPYTLCLNVVVERFCFALADGGPAERGRVVAERRDQALDASLLAAWQSIRQRGTAFLRPAVIRERIAHLDLSDKSASLPGLELADLVVSPIGRHVAGKPDRADWRVVEAKLRRRRGSYVGAGLVILPKE